MNRWDSDRPTPPLPPLANVPLNDGGPAFARPISRYNHDGTPCDMYDAQDGMSLRDYFAGQLIAAQDWDDNAPGLLMIARRCYEIADAMLAARAEKRPLGSETPLVLAEGGARPAPYRTCWQCGRPLAIDQGASRHAMRVMFAPCLVCHPAKGAKTDPTPP